MSDLAFIKDRKLAGACTASNVATMKGKATQLKDLVNFVQARVAEIDQQKSSAELIAVGLLATKAIKATADAFIDLSATIVKESAKVVPALRPMAASASAVKDGYGAISQLASGATKMALGQKGGVAELAKAALGGVDYGAKKVGKTAGMTMPKHWEDCMRSFSKNTTSTFIDAANQDTRGVLKDVRTMSASCSAAVVQDAATTIFNDSVGSRMGAGVNIANTLYSYNDALTKAFDEWGVDQEDVGAFDTRKKMMARQLNMLTKKIAELDAQLKSCGEDAGGGVTLRMT